MLASDLHVHLDGSLRDETLVALARDAGLIPATADGDEFARRLRFRPGMSLSSCLSRFDRQLPRRRPPLGDPLLPDAAHPRRAVQG